MPDLLRVYGVDLRELVSDEGDLSPRRALSLIEGLPHGTRSIARIQEDPELEGWDVSAFLAAALIESVRENTFATVQIQSKKKLKHPEPLKIPGNSSPKKKTPPANMFTAMARAQLNRRDDGG